MHIQTLVAVLSAITLGFTAASPYAEPAPMKDNCNNYIGHCYSNDCHPTFSRPADIFGRCQAGKYKHCPCHKCGGPGNNEIGKCNQNGCNGMKNKVCKAGIYKGCGCA